MINSKKIYKNVGLGLIYKPLSIVFTFSLVTYSLLFLDNFLYGIWATILSIISWINYFDIGIGNGLRNHLTTAITLNRKKDIRELISTSYVFLMGVSFFMLIILYILIYSINWNSLLKVDNIKNEDLQFLVFINIIFFSFSFVVSLVKHVYFALHKASVISLMQLVNQLFNFIGVYLILYFYKGEASSKLMAISVVYGLAQLGTFTLFSYPIFRTKILRPSVFYFTFEKLKIISNLGIQFFIIQLAALVIFTTDNLVVSNLFGPEEVTVYQVVLKFFSILITFHAIIMSPFWSGFTQAMIINDYVWIKKIITKLIFLQILIFFVGIVMIFLFPYVTDIWLGKSIKQDINLILMVFVYVMLTTWTSIYAYVLNGIGDLKLQLYIAIIQGVLNIPLSLFFVKFLKLDSYGVILGTNLVLLVGAILLPVYFYKIINKMKYDKNI